MSAILTDIAPEGGISSELIDAATKARGNIVVDEWSCALTGHALDGLEDKDAGRAKFCTEQLELYTNVTAGWSFWSKSYLTSLMQATKRKTAKMTIIGASDEQSGDPSHLRLFPLNPPHPHMISVA